MNLQSIKEYIKKGILLLCLAMYPVLSFGQEQPEVIKIAPSRIEETDIVQLLTGPKSFDFDLFESRIQLLWFKRKAFLNANRIEEAERHMEMLKFFCQQEGIRRLPTIARALTFEGINYFQEGNFEKAKTSFNHAIGFDPFLAQPRIELAKTYWKSEGGIWNALKELIKAISFFVQSFWTVIIISSNFTLIILISLGALFIFFSSLMAWKYNKHLRHELVEYYEGKGSKSGARLMSWTILWLPLFTIVGVLFIFFYWPIIFFRYMNRKEKIISFAFFMMFFFVIFSLMMVRSVFNVAVDEEVKISLESASGSYDPEKIIKLQEQIKNHPDDPTYHFLIAGIYKRGGYYQESFNHYMKVLDLNPVSYQALNNIGNIFFKFGQFSQAIIYYKKALNINSKFILAYMNMSLAQTESFHFKDAEETMRKARVIDAKEAARWISGKGEQEHAEAIDATIDTTNIWKKALAGKASLNSSGVPMEEKSSRYGVYINMLSLTSFLSLVILFILIPKGRSSVVQCIKCGRISCLNCGYYKEFPNYCTHCVHLFIKKDGLEPNAESIKQKEIRKHKLIQRNVSRILGFAFPGSRQMIEDKSFSGIFLAFLWLFSICGFLISDELLNISEPGMISFSSIVSPIFFILLLLSWIIGNIRLFARQGGHS